MIMMEYRGLSLFTNYSMYKQAYCTTCTSRHTVQYHFTIKSTIRDISLVLCRLHLFSNKNNPLLVGRFISHRLPPSAEISQ